MRPCRLHELGGILVIEDLGSGSVRGGMSPWKMRVAPRGIVPVPLDEPLEEDADHA